MRQVFSSPRLENVERVAKLLGEAGIDARITHGRSYKGGLRGDFSYRDHVRVDPIPAVWIVKSEDQPAAREILRAAGLLDSTRGETGYTLPIFRTEEPIKIVEPGRKRAFRLKVGLLGVIAMVIVLAFLSTRKPAVVPAAALPAGDSATPDALARAVLAGELPTRAGQTICLSVDGHDPTPALLGALPAPKGVVIPESRCFSGAQQLHLAVSAYRTRPGTPSGTIELTRRRGAALVTTHHYDVRPEGASWRVIEPVQ